LFNEKRERKEVVGAVRSSGVACRQGVDKQLNPRAQEDTFSGTLTVPNIDKFSVVLLSEDHS
jgi:hypothetical protein